MNHDELVASPRRLDLLAFHLDAQLLGAQAVAVLSAAHADQHHVGVLSDQPIKAVEISDQSVDWYHLVSSGIHMRQDELTKEFDGIHGDFT